MTTFLGTSITMMQLQQFNTGTNRYDRSRQLSHQHQLQQQRPKTNCQPIAVANAAARRSQREEDIFS